MRYMLLLIAMTTSLAAKGQPAAPVSGKIKELTECWKEEKRKYEATGGGGKISSGLDVSVTGIIKKLAGVSVKAGGVLGGEAEKEILQEFQTTTHPEAQKEKFRYCYLAVFHPNASLSQVFPAPLPTAATSRPRTASTARGSQLKCAEFDKCPGKVESCVLAGDDDDENANLLIENTTETPIVFGEWANEQCGTSGVGWHAYYGSCGTNTGSRFKRCKYVFTRP